MKNIYILGLWFFLLPTLLSAQEDSVELFVDGICGMCEDRIEAAALTVRGVQTAEWDVDTRMLNVGVNPLNFNSEKLHKTIAAVGHDTKSVQATDVVYDNLHGCCKYRDQAVIDSHRSEPVVESIPSSETIQTDRVSLFVDGICGMCEDRIEAAALTVRGVESAAWDVETRMLSLDVSPLKFNLEKLHKIIAAVGHDTKWVQATDAAYEDLHGCCKYRNQAVIDSHRPAAAQETPSSVSIFVNGVCAMCRDRILSAAGTVVGVESASWDMETRILTVGVNPDVFQRDNLQWAMIGAGHDTKEWLTDDATYENLHDCCKYREFADPVPTDEELAPLLSASQGQTAPETQEQETINTTVSGRIVEQIAGDDAEPLVGVNVYWADTKAGTSTDGDGTFSLERDTENQLLVISYVGFASDTIDMSGQEAIEVVLDEAVTLEEVEVNYRRRSSEVSFVAPIKTLEIDERELMKAACCNLSESFETNPSVDVSFTDAVTGTRQIQMLGLAGPYVQITQELMPGARSLSAIQGLSFIPGPWIQGIQLIKGPGSVVQGFESMTGQINVELKKPEDSELLYVNLYANEGGRLEANVNAAFQVSERLYTSFLVHGNTRTQINDRNEDGFLDMPINETFTAINRWKHMGTNGWNGQVGVKYATSRKGSGQITEDKKDIYDTDNPLWNAVQEMDRLEVWAKTGRVFPNRPTSSIGFQASGVFHKQFAGFGFPTDLSRNYFSQHRSAYFNGIYQDILGVGGAHTYKFGLSFQMDDIQEGFAQEGLITGLAEYVPGAFAEYTYQPTDNFTAVLGLRGDYHNLYGAFATPRLFLRYAPNSTTVLRASAGRGQRRPVIYAEQLGAFASNRAFSIRNAQMNDPFNQLDTPYGLNPEVSWNFGINLTQYISVGQRDILVSADVYHTFFESQIVADYDQDPQALHFYNLDGRSYSNSLQLQLDYELLTRWDVRVAYRFNDVQMTFDEGLREKPFVAKHRAFINTAYETLNGWAFDLTVNWQGSKRIPDTFQNPEAYQLEERSPDFFMVNTQVSKTWGGIFDLYVGAENLLNFVQENPILAVEDPSSQYFDASLVWGPIFGRNIYAGLRYRIE